MYKLTQKIVFSITRISQNMVLQLRPQVYQYNYNLADNIKFKIKYV